MVWAVSLSTTKLISRSLTPEELHVGIRSLIGFGRKYTPPHPTSALPPTEFLLEADPKAISRRTR
jgi:hypothetical protein